MMDEFIHIAMFYQYITWYHNRRTVIKNMKGQETKSWVFSSYSND